MNPSSPRQLLFRQGGSFIAVGLAQLLLDWLVFVGLTALGVPVYNGLGQPVVCIAVIGPHARWQAYAQRTGSAPAADWLRERAARLSAQLGFYPR